MPTLRRIKLNGVVYDLGGDTNVLDQVYPVGSIYMSVNLRNPASFIGGTWERMQDRFLVGAGEAHPAGETGGAESVTLTAANIPSHSHDSGTLTTASATHQHKLSTTPRGNLGESYSNYASQLDGDGINVTVGGGDHTHSISGQTGATGNGAAFDNLPPYLSVYMWVRTA